MPKNKTNIKYPIREPEASELEYFSKNPNVSGMATEDDRVILNPYSKLSKEEFDAVALNETARIAMKNNPNLQPKFNLTEEQKNNLSGGSYASADESFRRATIAARLLSGDPSGGKATPEQQEFVENLRKNLQSEQEEQPKMAKGGMVNQTKRLLKEGGMMQEGGTVDPESGNKVPVGAMQEEVRDDVPAQLSEGEFVFPADVVRYIGLERLMQMRQAAKEGLMKMEDMGQMSNGEEGDEEEDTAEFESQLDEIMGEMGKEEEEVEMAVGGAVVPQPQQPMAAPTAATELPSNPMQDMQRVAAAPASTMTTSQIIKQDTSTDPKKAQELLSKVAMNKAVLLRDSDTVFVGEAITPGTVKLHTFTADSPESLPAATTKIVDTLKQSGVKEITGDVKDEAVVTALKDAGYNPEVMESPEGGSTYSVKLEEMV